MLNKEEKEMLNFLRKEANKTYTENGAATYKIASAASDVYKRQH